MKLNILKNAAVLFLSVILFSACSDKSPSIPDPNPLHYFSDMEQYVGFVEGAPVMKSDIAHSGKYLVKIDTAGPFGIGFNRRLKEISSSKLRRVEISAYFYSESLPAAASLVCTVDNNDYKPVYYEILDASKLITKAKEWTKVQAVFYLSESLLPDQRIVIYGYNPHPETIYLDDFEINFSTE